jgi:hypothetical protein
MNPTNKKSPEAKGRSQQSKQLAGPAHQFKPAVAQLKNTVSAQSAKPPIAPPVYRPLAKPLVAQAKIAGPSQMKAHPVAPRVYSPHPTSKVLQTKKAHLREVELSHKGVKAPGLLPIQKRSDGPRIPRPPVSPGTIQPSERQRDIRNAKIYSGQHGGMWYPSGSSSTADKIWQEHGITAHELFTGPSGPATRENIQAYWKQHPTLTKSQLAARYGISLDELEKILAG